MSIELHRKNAINFIIMDNKEHYNQFLEYLDIAKSEERCKRDFIKDGKCLSYSKFSLHTTGEFYRITTSFPYDDMWV